MLHSSRQVLYVWVTAFCLCPAFCQEAVYSIRLTVTTELSHARVPMDPMIDLGAIVRDNGLPGVLDPNSIQVVDETTREVLPCAVTEDFAYGDAGRVEWVIENPGSRAFAIRFQTSEVRPALEPAAYTPLIGTGDLLRYNAGALRPIALVYPSGMVDVTGDGVWDLLGCWNYAYRPGCPWNGIIVYPGTGRPEDLLFGELGRVRYAETPDSTELKHFTGWYMQTEFADLNGDGNVDLVFSPRTGDTMQVFLNTQSRDAGGWPVFRPDMTITRPPNAWGPIRIADLDNDGLLDITAGAVLSDADTGKPSRCYFLRNTNPDGWPLSLAEPVDIAEVEGPCFFDVDGDGILDAVGLVKEGEGAIHEYAIAWQRGLGGNPPTFGEVTPLEGVAPAWPTAVAAVDDGVRRGILVGCDLYQRVAFFEHTSNTSPYFARKPDAQSLSAVVSLGDQAWPWACDWDGDGDLDLLVGGGYGWPRILINEGTTARPAYAEAAPILANGEPIRVVRNDVLGEPHHWHNMGYPYPAYVDWDADGLPDLILPNETNRIIWYKNVGTRRAPVFANRQQILVDGYPDSPELRRQSAERALDATYPLEEEQPFFWRTRPGFADWNEDGLVDLVTHDGATRKLTLFTQYRDGQGSLRLEKSGAMSLADGRLIDDTIVERSAHWTEGFNCVDWDGDGLTDIVYSCAGTESAKGSIYLLRNCGKPGAPVFEAPRTLCCFGTPIKVTDHGPHPWVGDFDGDGKADLLACVEWSVYPFFSHAAIELSERPAYELGEVTAAP